MKVPVPEVDHIPVEAPPVILPFNTTFALFAQKVWSGPAFTIPGGRIFILSVSLTGEHNPIFVAVKTRVM